MEVRIMKKEPNCSICNREVKENKYIWVPDVDDDGNVLKSGSLYHNICFKTSEMKYPEPKSEEAEEGNGESVTVPVDTLKAGTKTK